MYQPSKDLITSAAFSLRVDGKPSFMLLLTAAGAVKRMGYSSPYDDEATIASGHEEGLFDQLMESVSEALLEQAGVFEDPGTEGPRCHWRIELAGGPGPVGFELQYCAESAEMPADIGAMVAKAEEITNDWYAEQLRESGATGGGPAPPSSPASVAAGRTEPAWAADADAPAPDDAPESLDPAASRKRIALAVLLDFFALSFAWSLLLIVTGSTPPFGLGAFLFVLVEFCMLQFARRSPGYRLLAIRAPLGEVPRVDRERLARESLATHVTAVVLLRSGLSSMLAFAEYEMPIPYFGLSPGPVVSGLFSALLGAGFVAAGVLILRGDLRGVWMGAGAVGVSFLATWLARGSDLDLWMAQEMTARRQLQGRPIDLDELDFVQSLVEPIVLVVVLLYGAGLYLTWKRLRASEGPVTP